MKTAAIALLVLGAGVGAAESPTRASFTNRQGEIFLNVTMVRTNRDAVIFKKEGQLGFFTEKLTNLPERVQWDFRAREREIKAILDARANDTAPEKLAALREVQERFRRIDEKTEQLQNGARERLEKTRREEMEIQARRGDEELIKLAKGAVESRLLAPTTAKFSDLWVSGDSGSRTVHGTVSAQNLFGATLSRRFEVYANQIDRDGNPHSRAVYFSLQEFAKETERIWN